MNEGGGRGMMDIDFYFFFSLQCTLAYSRFPIRGPAYSWVGECTNNINVFFNYYCNTVRISFINANTVCTVHIFCDRVLIMFLIAYYYWIVLYYYYLNCAYYINLSKFIFKFVPLSVNSNTYVVRIENDFTVQ